MRRPHPRGLSLRIAAVAILALLGSLAGCGDNSVKNADNELTSFAFRAADNAALAADVAATISGTTVTATLPTGTDVTALVASFETTGTLVTVEGVAQDSGTSAQDFTSPVAYTITAESGAQQRYTVTVTVPAAGARELTAFAFLDAANDELAADVTATINGDAIAATVPFGTDVTALVATFTTTGASVEIAGTTQVSGTTANDFTSPVTYTVVAADAATRAYTVTVTEAPSTAKALTAFAFTDAANPALTADVTATITGTAITATVPFGTDVSALIATFTTTGASVAVGATAQVSGTTPNDFAAPVTYTVTAADASTQAYTVTVAIAPNPAKDLTAFAFASATNPGLPADVVATITGTTIAATVPAGTDVTALVATFATTGASVTVGGTAQVSGTTANDFTSPVSYVVTAADASTQTYTVSVTIAPSTSKELTAFGFTSALNGLPADVDGVFTGTDVAVTVPFGTDVSSLIATFAHDGASVTIAGTPQMSGLTANDFTAPVVYTVVAADSSTQAYTVTVTITAASTANDLTAFEFTAANNPALAGDVTATITGTDIAVDVPLSTDLTALVATFTTTGASVAVGATTQVSGITANDFTAPVVYTVTAEDASTQTYTVTVTAVPSTAKALTAFAFLAADNPALATDVTATITGTDIAANLPVGTDLTALVATFTTTGASVEVNATAQVSGTTANDFTAPVVYTVTAEDASTAAYTVTVTAAPVPAATLILNEIGANITSSKDLIELRALTPGTVKDFTVEMNLTATVAVLATLPDITVAAGELIVIHITPGAGIVTETTSQADCADAACYPGAWDVRGASTNITYSSRVLVVRDAASTIQNAVPFTTTGTPAALFFTDLQALQAAGLWLPADCGGELCTATSTPTGRDIAASWTGSGTTPAGASVQRTANLMMASDWTVVTSTFGAAN